MAVLAYVVKRPPCDSEVFRSSTSMRDTCQTRTHQAWHQDDYVIPCGDPSLSIIVECPKGEELNTLLSPLLRGRMSSLRPCGSSLLGHVACSDRDQGTSRSSNDHINIPFLRSSSMPDTPTSYMIRSTILGRLRTCSAFFPPASSSAAGESSSGQRRGRPALGY